MSIHAPGGEDRYVMPHGGGLPEYRRELVQDGFVEHVYDVLDPAEKLSFDRVLADAQRRGIDTWRLVEEPGNKNRKHLFVLPA